MLLVRMVRRLARVSRNAVDSQLYKRRRSRARQRFAELTPSSIVFICLGNICRSPYAERVWAMQCDGVDVESAGFIGPDRPPPEAALAVARRRGVIHDDHRSKTATPELLESADVLFVFDRSHIRRLNRMPDLANMAPVFFLGDFDTVWTGQRDIPDPWGKAEAEFDRVFARIERCVAQVLATVIESGSAGDETTGRTP
jgi:protein-tyrosine phosphatase